MADTAWLDEAPDASWLDEAPEVGAEIAPPAPTTGVVRAYDLGQQRGLTALPGIAGLDRAKIAAAAKWAYDRTFGETGRGERSEVIDDTPSFSDFEAEERREEGQAERDQPLATGVGIGIGAAPSMAAMPQAKVAEGAGLGARALASGLTAGAQSAAIEGGVTNDLPIGERLTRMGTAGAAGMAIGGLVPMPSHVPGQQAIDDAAGVPRVPGNVEAWLRKKAGERNLKAAGAIQSDITRSRRQLGPGGVNNGREELTEIGAEMGEKKLVGPLSTPDSTFGRAATLLDDAGERMGVLLRSADESGASRPQWQRVFAEGDQILAGLRADPNNAAAANHFEQLLAGYMDKAGLSSRGVSPAPPLPGAPPWMTRSAEIRTERPLSFVGLHGIRKQVDKALYGMRGTKDPWADAYKTALHDLRSAVSREIDTSLDAATSSSPAWKAANRDYQVGAKALEFADKGMDRAVGNNLVSPMEFLGGTTAGIMGTQAYGASGGIAALAGTAATMFARRHGSGLAGSAMLKLSKALKANPEQFGAHTPGLLASAERGPEALAAAHYVLSLRPGSDYRVRFQQAVGEEEEPE